MGEPPDGHLFGGLTVLFTGWTVPTCNINMCLYISSYYREGQYLQVEDGVGGGLCIESTS